MYVMNTHTHTHTHCAEVRERARVTRLNESVVGTCVAWGEVVSDSMTWECLRCGQREQGESGNTWYNETNPIRPC